MKPKNMAWSKMRSETWHETWSEIVTRLGKVSGQEQTPMSKRTNWHLVQGRRRRQKRHRWHIIEEQVITGNTRQGKTYTTKNNKLQQLNKPQRNKTRALQLPGKKTISEHRIKPKPKTRTTKPNRNTGSRHCSSYVSTPSSDVNSVSVR